MYTVLICDDDRDIVSALEIYLTREGYRTVSAYNGEQAIRYVNEENIDLILMDIMMPVMDGLEATRAIRAMEREDCRAIPIIAMSANAFDDDLKKSVACGMNGHLSKPVEVERLYQVLHQVLRQAQADAKKDARQR